MLTGNEAVALADLGPVSIEMLVVRGDVDSPDLEPVHLLLVGGLARGNRQGGFCRIKNEILINEGQG